MKRRLFPLLLGVVMAFGLTACGGDDPAPADSDAQEVEQPEQPQEPEGLPSEGDVGTYYVSLGDCAFGQDYEGNNMIVINYDFTNNGEDDMSPLIGVYIEAFQDGIQLEHAIVLDASVYDAGISQKQVKPGATLTGCQNAYVLTSDSPVEVEVSDIFSAPTVGKVYEVEQ